MRGRSSLLALIFALAGCSMKATYPTKCDLILSGWMTPADARGDLMLWNRVILRNDGSLRWNGFPVSESVIAQLAHQATTLNPRPITILEIDAGVDCGRVRVIRNLIDQQAKCQEIPGRLCGEGKGFEPYPSSR